VIRAPTGNPEKRERPGGYSEAFAEVFNPEPIDIGSYVKATMMKLLSSFCDPCNSARHD
jgi:hypothetical protein